MNFIIDPDLKYCPDCEDEYRAEIEVCAVCGRTLLSGRRVLRMQEERKVNREDRAEEITADDKLVDIHRGSVVEIKNIQAMLKKEGITSVTAADQSCGKGCCGSELFLKIRVDDLREALAFLEKEHIRSTGLEDHDLSTMDAVFNTAAFETTCPACGCKFAPTTPNCPDCGLCFA